MNDVAVDLLKTFIIASGAAIITTLLPLLFGMRFHKEEKGKLKAEVTDVNADAASKIVAAAGQLQDSYSEVLNELRDRTREYRGQVDELLKKLADLEQSNKELRAQIIENTRQLEESKTQLAQSQAKIQELIVGVAALSKQIEDLGQSPVYRP